MHSRQVSVRSRRLSKAVRPVIEGLEERRLFNAIVVNTTNDAVAADGFLSLREAVLAANNDNTVNEATGSGVDSITFDSTVFSDPQTIVLTQGQLTIADQNATTINGGGKVSIDGNASSRVFEVETGASLKLIGLTITSGKAENGGGIYNGGTLIVENSKITNNVASGVPINNGGSGSGAGSNGGSGINGGFGGGIYTSQDLTVINSTIDGNTAQGGAGGNGGDSIGSPGAGAGGGAGFGGGIYISSGNATINGSTISNNAAIGGSGGKVGIGGNLSNINDLGGGGGGGGPTGGPGGQGFSTGAADGGFGGGGGGGSGANDTGGIGGFGGGGGANQLAGYGGGRGGSGDDGGGGAGMGGGLFNKNGGVTVTNSTFSGNSATGGESSGGGGGGSSGAALGGAVFAYGGVVTFINSTVAQNSAVAVGNGSSYAGGVFVYDTGEVDTGNSIFAKNTAALDPDFHGMAYNNGHNLLGDITGASNFSTDSYGDVLDVDPKLGQLASNGGPTKTYYLLKDSPAIDDGLDSIATDNALTTDQRGTGFTRVVGDHVDIGAVEVTAFPVVTVEAVSDTEGNGGDKPFTFNVKLNQAGLVPVIIHFHTANGTATAGVGSDYAARVDQTLQLDPGVTESNISVSVHGDTVIEGDETFSLVIDSVENGSIASGSESVTGTIRNDDATSAGKPAAPSGLTGLAVSGTEVKLNWIDKANNETGFEVQYAKKFDFSSPTTVVIPDSVDAFTYTVPGLSPLTWYYFRVRAQGEGGTFSVYTKSVKIKTLKGAVVVQPKPTITSFSLIDSDTNGAVYTITDGEALSKNGILGYLNVKNFSVRANVTGPVESVRFAYAGKTNYRTENLAPFSLFGDGGTGDYNGKPLNLGSYVITATAYSKDNALGIVGTPVTLHFTVVA